jgi:hypothetical protein
MSMTLFGFPPGRSNPEAFAHLFTNPANGNRTHLHVDAIPNNGTSPCHPIDTTRTVQVGETYDVGLCLETYAPNTLEAFVLRLYYDDINTSPTLEGPTPMLDLNPNANDGDDPAGFKLGAGWDCSGFTVFPPVGDDANTACQDQYGQPISPCHDAVITCNANIGTPDLDLSADPGLLATVQFTATGEGTEQLTWGDDTELVGDVVQPGGGGALCGPAVPSEQIGCFGATLQKVTFDCLFEDTTGQGTSLGIFGNNWVFEFPGGSVQGTGRVMHAGPMTFVAGRSSGLAIFAFGRCPAGPATAFAMDMSGFPARLWRLSDRLGADN